MRAGQRRAPLTIAVVLAGCLGLAATAGSPVRAEERVDITATDGVQLIGRLDGTSGAGVVLAHMEQADQRSWESVSRTIAARGFRTLRFDFRGHGQSAGPADLAASDRDLEGAYRYLLARKIRPVFLVGAGVGGTAALIVAARVPVAGVLALSSAPAYQTLDASTALAALRVPALLMYADEDQPAAKLAALASTPGDTTRILRLAGRVRGPDLLSTPAALETLLDFLTRPHAPGDAQGR